MNRRSTITLLALLLCGCHLLLPYGPSSSSTDGGVQPDVQDAAMRDDGAARDLPSADDTAPLPDASASCGNAVMEKGEVCDRGALNSPLPDAPCRPDCTRPRCGDGVLDAEEQCDDGNGNQLDGCDNGCRLAEPSGLQLHPPALHFGSLGLGCPARTRTVSVVNPTSAAIELLEASLLGCPDDVALAVIDHTELPPGSHVDLSVVLEPTNKGLHSCRLQIGASDGVRQIPVTALVSPASSQTDLFGQDAQRKADILLLLDPSGSMLDELPRLLAAVPTLVTAANSHSIDFHLGGISISELPSGELGQLLASSTFATATTPNMEDLLSLMFDLPSFSGEERALDACIAALSPPLNSTLDPGSCNQCSDPHRCVNGACRGANWGFRRTDASLELLVITDEPDGSTASAEQTLVFLRQMVNPLLGQFVRFFALLPQPACAADLTFPRYQLLVQQTGGQVHDLCALIYQPMMQAMTEQIFGLRSIFYLTRWPDSSTIKVQVNGKAAGGFDYDVKANAVVFPTPPADQAIIEISYATACGG